ERAEEAALDVRDVHRAALPARDAIAPPEELGHQPARVDPLCERMPVAAVVREDGVVGRQGRDDADGDRLLTDRGVDCAGDLTLLVPAIRGLFEAANQEHPLVERERRLARGSERAHARSAAVASASSVPSSATATRYTSRAASRLT